MHQRLSGMQHITQARAGIVHNGNLEKMREAARLSLVSIFPRHGRADHVRGYVENYLGARATDSSPAFGYFGKPITEVKIVNNRNLAPGTIITFDDPAQAQSAVITVQVVHHYELVVPLVNRMVFYVYKLMREGPGYQGQSLDNLAAVTDQKRRTGDLRDIEYRIPLVAHYTMRLQSDYEVE